MSRDIASTRATTRLCPRPSTDGAPLRRYDQHTDVYVSSVGFLSLGDGAFTCTRVLGGVLTLARTRPDGRSSRRRSPLCYPASRARSW